MRAPLPPLDIKGTELAGRTAVVIGNGTSLLDPEWTYRLRYAKAHRGAYLMVANGGFSAFPFADCLMCSDRHWLAGNPDFRPFGGERIIVTSPRAAAAVVRRDPRMREIRRAYIDSNKAHDIFGNPRVLYEGHTSTTTNISAAVLMGVKRIVLVGIDLAPGPDGRRRLYDETRDTEAAARTRYSKQVRHFKLFVSPLRLKGVEVVNCSPRSALDCWPYATWEDLSWP